MKRGSNEKSPLQRVTILVHEASFLYYHTQFVFCLSRPRLSNVAFGVALDEAQATLAHGTANSTSEQLYAQNARLFCRGIPRE